ncbi:MAG: sigma-70 family RNA polymerase sigma factor [Ruminococcus sp.]|nr:sigma-70 family RNA polymerase sigma factor [Ruminococcus sp.]
MTDSEITELFNNRDERALTACEESYGSLIKKIAQNILGDTGESEEVQNDTLLKAWNSIPPDSPKSLAAYLSVMVRNIALDRYRKKAAAKRSHDRLSEPLDEIGELLPSSQDLEKETEQQLFIDAVNRFLSTLSQDKRRLFIRRYFYLDSISDICKMYSLSESKVKVTLMRTRKKLAEYLKKEDFL